MKGTFKSWIAKVDAYLEAKCGLGHLDLADCPYYDWYEDGVSPKTAAARAIRENMFG